MSFVLRVPVHTPLNQAIAIFHEIAAQNERWIILDNSRVCCGQGLGNPVPHDLGDWFFRLRAPGHCIAVHILRMHDHSRIVHAATIVELPNPYFLGRIAQVRYRDLGVLVVDVHVAHGQRAATEAAHCHHQAECE
jgi:hypothetical protein